MISFRKKKKAVQDETGLEKFLYTLIIRKSPLLKEYAINDKNRKMVIDYKYNLSKCNELVYYFSKYCSEDLDSVTIQYDSQPMNFPYGDWVDVFKILDADNGFRFHFFDERASVSIKTSSNWSEISTDKTDYNVLADVYRSVKNSQDINNRIQKQKEVSTTIEGYKSKYGT